MFTSFTTWAETTRSFRGAGFFIDKPASSDDNNHWCLWLPRTGLEPARLVVLATNTGGMATPCVYQFHHLGKNDPPLTGGGFFIGILLIHMLIK